MKEKRILYNKWLIKMKKQLLKVLDTRMQNEGYAVRTDSSNSSSSIEKNSIRKHQIARKKKSKSFPNNSVDGDRNSVKKVII